MQTSTADLGLLGPNCQRQSCYPSEICWKFYMCNFSQVNFCIPNKAFHGKICHAYGANLTQLMIANHPFLVFIKKKKKHGKKGIKGTYEFKSGSYFSFL